MIPWDGNHILKNQQIINKCIEEFEKKINYEFKNGLYDKEPLPKGKILLKKCYMSIKDTLLIHLELHTKDKLIYNDHLLCKWFLYSNNEIQYLGSFTNLIDAADYDKDGSSDLMFFTTRMYNGCYYTLLYNNAKKRAQFYYGIN